MNKNLCAVFVLLLALIVPALGKGQTSAAPLDLKKPETLPEAQQMLAESARFFDAGKFAAAAASAQNALEFFRKTAATPDQADAALYAGRAWSRLDSFSLAKPLLQEAIDMSQKAAPNGSRTAGKAYTEMARMLSKTGRASQAIETAKKGLNIQQKVLPPNDVDLVTTQHLIGSLYMALGLNHEAIPFLEVAYQSAIVCYGEYHKTVAKILVRLGVSYDYTGAYQQAIFTLEKALAIQQKILPPNDPDIASCYMALGGCQQSLKQYDNTLVYYEKALDIQRGNYGDTSELVAYAYSEIGQVYLFQEDYVKARKYFQQEADILIALGGTTDPAYGFACNDLGRACFGLKNYPDAIQWQKQALTIFRNAYHHDNEDIGAVLLYLGRAQSANGDYEAALQSFSEDQQILRKTCGADCPTLYFSDAEIALTLKRWYVKTGQDSLLEKSRGYFRRAEQGLIQRVPKETHLDTQRKLLYEALPIMEGAIDAEALVWNKTKDETALEKAWQLSESMHSYLLFSASQEANARRNALIPNTRLAADSALSANIFLLEKQRQSLLLDQGMPPIDPEVLALNAAISSKKNDLNQLRSQFETQYPEYHRLKYHVSTTTLTAARQLLSPRQTLLEYYTGDSAIFVFVLHQNDRQVFKLPRDFPLADWVKKMREGITGYYTAPVKTPELYQQTLTQYADYAARLQKKLLAPLVQYLTPELIIIPGELLADLPFGALLTGAPKDLSNFNTFPFLLKTHSVHYAYSATMLEQMAQRPEQNQPEGDLLALAPFFEADTASLAARTTTPEAVRLGLSPLPYSGEEVQQVAKRIGGNSQTMLGALGTKQQFLRQAGSYRILHLATHGKANHQVGNFSFLAFAPDAQHPENNLLYVDELYNCTLRADLVVLSACETGIGETQRGEGIVSLARAFAFAGAKTVVSSLWSVNDQSTMQVMDTFYAELKKGASKNVAMTNAKKQYLTDHPGRKSHPFFWAGFIVVGDLQAIKN